MSIVKFYRLVKPNPFLVEIRKLLTLFTFWRILLLVIAFLGPYLVINWGNRFPYVQEQLISTKLPYWIWSWGNFDGVHYLTIAKSYYSANYTQTFFPFYPLLIRIITKTIFFDHYLLAGLFISNLSFFVSLYFLKKLLILDGYKNYLKWIFIFILIFPTSFYFGSLYSESLFLMLIIGSLYLARQNKWFYSIIFGIIASATRLMGIFILPALIYEYILHNRKKTRLTGILPLFLIPLGLVGYMVFLKIKFADPLFFWHAQPVFGAGRLGSGIILPPQVIYRYIKIFLSVNTTSLAFMNAFFEFFMYISGIILLVLGHKLKVRLSYLIFSWPCLILPSLTGTLSSMPRYILICFPIFIVLGIIRNKFIKLLILIFSFCLLFVSTILFTRGYWVG